MIISFLAMVLILGIVWVMTRNEICQRWYCRHKRKDHKEYCVQYQGCSCSEYGCACPAFLD